MKTIGVLGGMSWESTAVYYRLLNQRVRERLGGLHSAKLLLASVDFAEYAPLQHKGDWQEIGRRLNLEARALEQAGAELLLIATNTMHKVAEEVMAGVNIPLVHVVDAIGAEAQARGWTKPGLLATQFTMEEDFYLEPLREKYGLEIIVPEAKDRQEVHRVIFEELCHGNLRDASRQYYLGLIREFQLQGAEAVILGCTEVGLLITPDVSPLPLLDSVACHVEAALDEEGKSRQASP